MQRLLFVERTLLLAEDELQALGLGVLGNLFVEYAIESQVDRRFFLLNRLLAGLRHLLQLAIELQELALQPLEVGRAGLGLSNLVGDGFYLGLAKLNLLL